MKIKEIDRTVTTAWSPAAHHPILLAAGTSAQQLDASFNTSASLDLYELNLSEPSLDLDLKVSVPSQSRFHKIVWGCKSPGIIAGGCDDGVLQLYSAQKLLAKEDGLVAKPNRHSGPVKALDVNAFQANLLASGATSSEIFIWDMNNTATPMSPGSKPQPLEDVVWLSWNRQVQHILASLFSTKAVILDLRKNEPIIKITDSSTRVRWKAVSWHPDIATQLCLASEEDSHPVVQLWDLRFASSPLKTLQGHERGILAMSWCTQDPDLLITSGRDNKILCWNPNANDPCGNIVCEIPNTQQWIFEVNWCPRNPSLIASSSCDGHAGIYSLTGGRPQVQTTNKIADSFPGMTDTLEPQVPSSQQSTVDLVKAPKWLKRPSGASFSFGGKLVTFGSNGVRVCQVHSEGGLSNKSRELLQKLSEGRYTEICSGKTDPVWTYLEATFSQDPKASIKALLGYSSETAVKSEGEGVDSSQVDHLADQFSSSFTQDLISSPENDTSAQKNFDGSVLGSSENEIVEDNITPFDISTGNDTEGSICKAILMGDIGGAVDLCLKNGNVADALILAISSGPELLAKTQNNYLKGKQDCLHRLISSYIKNDWNIFIRYCNLSGWKEVLTALLTYGKDPAFTHLCQELGQRLEQAGGEYSHAADICYIASGNIAPLIHKKTAGEKLTSDCIQELVELLMVAQQAMSTSGHPFQIVGNVASLLTTYSEMLASEGDLEMALSYINNAQDEHAEDLRERLYRAMGLKGSAPTQPVEVIKPAHQPPMSSIRKMSASYQNVSTTSFPASNTFNQLPGHQPPPGQHSFPGHHPLPGQLPPTPGTNYLPEPPPSTFGQPHSKPTPAPPPAAAVPPPSMVRNTPSPQTQGVLASSKKYVVDPSVQGGYRSSTPAFGSSYMQSSYQSSAPSYPAPNMVPSPYNPNTPSSQYPGTTMAPSSYPAPSVTPSFPSGPAPPLNSSGFPPSSTQSPYIPSNPPMMSNAIPQSPPAYGQYNYNGFGTNQPQSQAHSIFQPNMQSQQNPLEHKPQGNFQPHNPIQSAQFSNTAKSGWNDPPPVAPKTQMKPEVHSQSPITHPLLGSAPGSAPLHQQFTPHQAPSSQVSTAYGDPPSGNPPRPPSACNEPRPPLPPEYLHIQQGFDDLRNRCDEAANNLIIKRKLEDVTRKLETMYDYMKDGRLSSETINSLDQMLNCLKNRDIAGAMSVQSQMVSGQDFSLIATFMTGLKVLTQTSQQLRVI